MPTIRDIAKAANVSPATVSKALGHAGDINEETAERVRTIAAQMGYHMDRLRRATKSNHLVGVIVPELNSSYYCAIYESFSRIMEAHGYRVLTITTDFTSPEKEWEHLAFLLSMPVSGILYLTENETPPKPLRTRARMENTPLVMITHMQNIDFCDVVGVNHFLGVRLALAQLYRDGHRKIAFLGEEKTELRRKAFCRYREELGLMGSADTGYVVIERTRSCEAGYHGAKKLLALPPEVRPTACVCAYDHIAYGAMRAFFEAGVRVPEEMSVIGINNTDISPFLTCALTSVEMPAAEVGRAAADLLYARMRGDTAPYRTTFYHPRLCLRESHGKCTPRDTK